MSQQPPPLNPDAQALDASSALASYPPVGKWDDWVEYDTAQWPRKIEKHCHIVPTICFNCEAACGLLGFIEKDTGRIRRFDGNPEHPYNRGSSDPYTQGTLLDLYDPDRSQKTLYRGEPREFSEFRQQLRTKAAEIGRAHV